MGGPGTRLIPPDRPGDPAAVREVQLALRPDLLDLRGGSVVVGVSGGPDSLALLAAALHVAVPLDLRVHVVCVDHGWHPRTSRVAGQVARAAQALGAHDARVVRVVPPVGASGRPLGGPEDAARTARLAALQAAAVRDGAGAVLLGHTLDDQAEQVLLGLARGSGARSLAGMPRERDGLRRPLLGLRRDVVRAAGPFLPSLGLPWHDPSNTDPAHLRAAVRSSLLPLLDEVLGAGAVVSLARSADLLRADDDALAAWARTAVADLVADQAGRTTDDPVSGSAAGATARPAPPHLEVELEPLRRLPDAVRTRVLRLLAARAGAGPLARSHTGLLDGLVLGDAGHGPVSLPGRVRALRTAGADGCGRLRLGPGPAPGPAVGEEPDGRR